VDDGSKSLEESVAMLTMAAECGTTGIVASPHCDLKYEFDPEVNRERIERLRAATDGRLRLYDGCDFHLTYDNVQDAITNPGKYTINHESYLLVEFSDLLIFRNSSEIFANLRDAGIRSIITHPERNRLLQQRLEKLREWVAEGCYLQVTASSLLGNFGKTAREFSLQLLEENLVHFIASDAHDIKYRPPSLKEAYEWMVKNYGGAYAQRLFVDNPRAAVAGAELEAFERRTAAPARKWFTFWRKS
jgi:protein-tyrosine phosphatase